MVTLDQLQTIDLQICGVSSAGYWNISNCNMDTGDGCYDVSSVYGIHRTLTGGFPIYFCVTKGTPFSLYNMNGSGQGNILLDCNGSGDPQGGQMLNLSYDDGSFVRYIQSDSNCDLEPCPY